MSDEGPSRSPLQWLFGASLLLLGSAIALQLALAVLAEIWPWVVGIGLLVGAITVAVWTRSNNRRRW